MSSPHDRIANLSRRSSVRNGPNRISHHQPVRQPSTLEIEVEYISTSQLTSVATTNSNLNSTPVSYHTRQRTTETITEDEEDEEEDEPSLAQPSRSPQVARILHQQTLSSPLLSHMPDDDFARLYQPSLFNTPAPIPSHLAMNGHGPTKGGIGYSNNSHSNGNSTGRRYDSGDVPGLITTGSRSEDEDEDEVQSPIDCLELQDEDEDEDEGHYSDQSVEEPGRDGQNDLDQEQEQDHQDRDQSHARQSSQEPISQGPARVPEIETQETLKRERTRILERSVVSSYRQISYKDISNIQPLKRGGFGEIHTAEWSRLKVVLKRALVEHSEGVEQFDQELEILKRVHDYDFIVPFYGVAMDPLTRVKCMVMKHCTNGNLCTFLQKHHAILSWQERYRLSIEITKGLEFLHKSGFHHRDLHSGNILLDDKRTAMICDFGLSRSSNKEQTADLVAAVGVASFLAPERFPTKRPIYSDTADIYSLGVIFWHISSGRIPFEKRLRQPALLKELMEGHREEIVPGTPKEYRDMLVKCWDVKPSRRLKIDVVIAILQTLMAKPTEPIHQMATGFVVPSSTTSAALPVPPELGARMANLERASNTLNKMVFDIQDPAMRETVSYIDRTRKFFREQRNPPEPYSHSNPPATPIYLCPLVGDLAALNYYLTRGPYNPINESSEQTGDTALHLACLFLESPMDTIKVLVELGADINLENLQGYTPVMILVSSNTQYCYEALRYFVMRGARIPAYIRHPITPLNSAQVYALNLVNESRQGRREGSMSTGGMASAVMIGPGQDRRRVRNSVTTQNQNVFQERNGRKVDRMFAQGRPLIHVVAAMQEDHRILDCLCEAGLDPAMSFGGETALVAAAAHLRIKNVEWLLNHDLDMSTEAVVQKAIKVVRMLHMPNTSHQSSHSHQGSLGRISGANRSESGPGLSSAGGMQPKEFPNDIRDLGKYSWAGVAYGDADGMSRDMVGPVLNLLEQWTGSRRVMLRKDVATKLKLMYGSQEDSLHEIPGSNGSTSLPGQGSYHAQSTSQGPSLPGRSSRSLRKNQRHLIDQVLNERSLRFW